MPPEKRLERHDAKPVPRHEEQVIELEHYEGLLPHPRYMREWEELIPGSAKSIFTRFENQSDHRIQIEKSVVRARNFKLYIGPIFALIISLSAIVAGLWIALKVQPYAGSLVSFSGLATLIAPFIASERAKSKPDSSGDGG